MGRPGVTPAGLGARDTLRLEVCFHLYGNDLSEDRNPIEAGLGWCCKLDTGFIGWTRCGVEPDQTLVPFVFTGPGIPRQGNPIVGGGIVTSGTLFLSRDRNRHGYVLQELRGARHEHRGRRSWQAAPRRGEEEAPVRKEPASG